MRTTTTRMVASSKAADLDAASRQNHVPPAPAFSVSSIGMDSPVFSASFQGIPWSSSTLARSLHGRSLRAAQQSRRDRLHSEVGSRGVEFVTTVRSYCVELAGR